MTSRSTSLRYPEGTKTVGTARVREDCTVGRSFAERELMRRTGNQPHSTFDEVADGIGESAIGQSVAASAKTASEIGDAVALGNEIKRLLKQTEPKKRSKYGNRKVVVDGITFDSAREGARYAKLAAMRTAGEITDLRIQVPFEVVPTAIVGGRKRPARRYIADFVYRDAAGTLVVEDVKGMRTAVYSIKRQLMKAVHGIDIVEVK